MNINGYTSTNEVLRLKRDLKDMKVELRTLIKYREWYQGFINANVENLLAVENRVDRKYLLQTDSLIANTLDSKIYTLKCEIESTGQRIVKLRQGVYDGLEKDWLNAGCCAFFIGKPSYLKVLKQNQKRLTQLKVESWEKMK